MSRHTFLLLLLTSCAPDEEPAADPRSTPATVDRTGAIRAVAMEPSVVTAAWSAESDSENANFGSSVAAGDVNGDGYDDVIVGSMLYTDGQDHEGRASVYLGSATGPAPTAAWSVESDVVFAYLGNSVASAGDVNADGYEDVLLGAVYHTNGETSEGRASLFLGSAAGPGATADWTAEGDQTYAYLGSSVASAGDVNGDGYDDVVVGAMLYSDGETYEGQVRLYLGSAAGLDATAAWTAESDQSTAYLGISVASAGDVNGDGYDDVVTGAVRYTNGQLYEGRASLYLGSASGLGTTAAWTAESDQADAYFGHSVASAGDVNGDGYGDVVVGASQYSGGDDREGRAYLFLGSAAGLDATAAWTAESDQYAAYFGQAVAPAGDVDGDGYDDVVIGARRYGDGQDYEGRVYVYRGSADGLATTATWTAEVDQVEAELGTSVAAGDLNGDGVDDVLAGAPYYTDGERYEGAVFVFAGVCESPRTWYADADGDGLGDPADTAQGCAEPTGYVANGDDPCPLDNPDDTDGDGVCDADDLCPDGDDDDDADEDGAPDACDPCPTDPGDTCGDTATDDTGDDSGADGGDEGDDPVGDKDSGGCRCSGGASGGWSWAMLGIAAHLRRRRRGPALTAARRPGALRRGTSR